MSEIIENIPEKQKNTKNKHSLLFTIFEIIVITLCVLLILCLIVFALYKATIDVSNKNEDKFDYVISEKNEIERDYSIKDFIKYSYEEDPNTINIEFPNEYFYECIANISKISSDLLLNDNVKLNRIGLLSNISKKNSFDFYADATYKDVFNCYVSGALRYEINENDIKLYVDSIYIGDGLPKFISDLLLKIHEGDLIYTYNLSDYEYLKDSSLSLDCVSNIIKSHKSFKFNYSYMSNLENVMKRIFKDNSELIIDNIKPMMPIIMEILIGENSYEYGALIKDIFPSIYEFIINNR